MDKFERQLMGFGMGMAFLFGLAAGIIIIGTLMGV